jgi:hypothetical protein
LRCSAPPLKLALAGRDRHEAVFRLPRADRGPLISALEAVGVGLAARRLDGAKETFIGAKVRGTDAEVFIYEDEAGLRGSNAAVAFVDAPEQDVTNVNGPDPVVDLLAEMSHGG